MTCTNGTLSAVLALTWALSGAGLGAIADRFNIRKPMLIASIVVFSLFSALSGWVNGFAMLLIFRALMGIAEGPVLPIAQSLMVEKSQPQRRGFNMGLIQGAAPGLLGGHYRAAAHYLSGSKVGLEHGFPSDSLTGDYSGLVNL
jgi:MFS family permease